MWRRMRPKPDRPDLRTRRFAARVAAVQAVFQHLSTGAPPARLLPEFHAHRLGETIEDVEYPPADGAFFDDVVRGVVARRAELDALISAHLAQGWSLNRLDRLMHALLAAGAYELVARPDVPLGAVISEYVDVARGFYDRKEVGFVNALLDNIGRSARAQTAEGPAA